MKTNGIQILLFWVIIIFGNTQLHSQVLIGPASGTPHESAALEIRSDSGGLLIPSVELIIYGNAVVAPEIPNPADGLMVFHDGSIGSSVSSGLPRGLWYYDEVSPGNGKWLIFSRIGSIYSSSLDNFGEMFEATDMGAGTTLTINNVYSIPWESAVKGYMGPGFEFLEDQSVLSETGTTVVADQLFITTESAYYTVDISATLLTSTSSNIVTAQLFINNIPSPGVFFRHAFQVAGEYVNCSTSGIIVVDQNDKLDFRFKTSTANEGILIEHLNLKLTKIGDL